MKIYGPKDKFKLAVKEKGIAFVLSPLTVKHKGEVVACVTRKSGDTVQDKLEMVRLALKHSLKAVEGFEGSDGKPYTLPVDESGVTDEGLDYILNLPEGLEEVTAAAMSLLARGASESLIDAETGEPMKGVEFGPMGNV